MLIDRAFSVVCAIGIRVASVRRHAMRGDLATTCGHAMRPDQAFERKRRHVIRRWYASARRAARLRG